MAEIPTSALQVTAAGLCISSRQPQGATGLHVPRDRECLLSSTWAHRKDKPSYDQYSFNRDNNISQHLPGTYLKAKVPPDNTISYTNHPPFAFGSWELLLQSFLIFSFQDAEAQELGGPVGREEAQLCSAAHKAVRVVPVIYHSQLRLFRMHHFLGNPDLALR